MSCCGAAQEGKTALHWVLAGTSICGPRLVPLVLERRPELQVAKTLWLEILEDRDASVCYLHLLVAGGNLTEARSLLAHRPDLAGFRGTRMVCTQCEEYLSALPPEWRQEPCECSHCALVRQ
jgi:hypothetical protein